MKNLKLFTLALGFLFTYSCRDEQPIDIPQPKGGYENGILMTNEGTPSTPSASVSYVSADLTLQEDGIFSKNNNGEAVGNLLQHIGFKGELAYLVLNVPNKVEVVNRYTFKKVKTITSNLSTPRYIAFTPTYTYITNHDFFSVRKVNIYDTNDSFVKSINFDRQAEKIVSSDGFIYVQSDGLTFDANWNEMATGHTVSRIDPQTNTVDKTLTLDDELIIRDMVADSRFVYVLTSDENASNLYKITAANGSVQKITLNTGGAQKLAMDQGKIYFMTGSNQVWQVQGSASGEMFTAETGYVYGFNVIDGKVFVSDPSFAGNSKVRVYSTSGTLLSTLTTGLGTSGFYKN